MRAWRSLLVLVASCVPATDELEPKGGITAVTVPSPASRGEPFVTSDGWTVRIEAFLLALAFGGSRDPYAGRTGQGSQWLFHASQPLEASVRAIPAGPAALWTELTSGYRIVQIGVNKGTDITPADEALIVERNFRCSSDLLGGFRPEAYLRARAERDGRSIQVESPLRIVGREYKFPVQVAPDVFTRVELAMHVEHLFAQPTGALVFDDIVEADRDHDGSVTVSELCDTKTTFPPPPCIENELTNCFGTDWTKMTVHEVLGLRTMSILVRR